MLSGTCFAQQTSFGGYDDYGTFSADPMELDTEASNLFGRFFQTNFYLGTQILTGELGTAYSAGLLAGLKFIFYFDRIWAAELGVGFGQSSGYYNTLNTGQNIDLRLVMTMLPVHFGIRYGFDQGRLTRGMATLNPFVSVNGALMYRTEKVAGNPTIDGLDSTLQALYGPGGIVGNTGFAINFGGGVEFNVYQKRLFLGVDLRYHIIFWSNANEFFGDLGRQGNMISLLGTASYNY